MRRFVQSFSEETLPSGRGARDVPAALREFPDRYNIAVRKPAAVIFDRGEGVRVEDFDWGLIPSWSAQPETKYTTVTARLDRAPRSRIFKRPWEQRRCVVPMNGYYKWDRAAKPPQPYFIQAQSGQVLFAAGLWDWWHREEPHVYSFAILTHANAAIPPPLTPDGPIFLPPDKLVAWIDGPWFPQRFLTGMPQPALEAYPVSRKIRNRDVDDYTLLDPVDPLEDAVASAGFDDEIEDEDD
jgi:putative SOS response-associated peptidase YedK